MKIIKMLFILLFFIFGTISQGFKAGTFLSIQEQKLLESFITNHENDFFKRTIETQNFDVGSYTGGYNLLLLCITADNYELFKYLIEKGVPFDSGNGFKNSILRQTINQERFTMVEYLIEKFAINEQDRALALISTIEEDRLSMTEYLIKRKNININAQDKNGKTALMEAAKHEDKHLFEYLVKTFNADITMQDNNGKTVLMYAASSYNGYQSVKFLLGSGVGNINAQDKDGNTALLYALRARGPLNAIGLLLRSGANPFIQNHNGEHFFSVAEKNNSTFWYQHEHLKTVLPVDNIREGLSLETDKDWTLFVELLYYGRLDEFKHMVNAKGTHFFSDKSFNLLKLSILFDNDEAFKYLTEKGATITDKSGQNSILSYARKYGQFAMVQYLKDQYRKKR